MIGRLSGVIIEIDPPNLLLDLNGLAYEVQTTAITLEQAVTFKDTIVLYTHLISREDQQTLYGFVTKEEQILFKILIKATGVGPKVALAILSGMPVHRLIRCIEHQEVDQLVKVPGVGRKTAQRLLIEIRDKVSKQVKLATSRGIVGSQKQTQLQDQVLQDAVSALEVLGYKSAQAINMIQSVQAPGRTCSELVRLALKALHSPA